LEESLVIMVVEDDQTVQGVVEEALIDGGFEPAIAASAEEAVTLLKGGLNKYRALVIDINLSGTMNGREVAKRAREIDPEFPIRRRIWIVRRPNSILLKKPFAPAQLVTG
jgi:CheY-like chemotaxis protein